MSLKKAISSSFLLFSSMIMLVHVSVFHHHNSKTNAFCSAIEQEQFCSNDAHNHNHDTHHCCTVENCFLSRPFEKGDDFKQIKTFYSSLVFITDQSVYQINTVTDLAGVPFVQKPYLLHLYSSFIAQSNGLRAPPVC